MKIILILSANPKNTTRLRLNEEMREITEGLRRARQRENFVIETGQAVRYRDILRAILDFEPNIVHFSGHGAGEEGLAFEDETGQVKLVKAEALANLFKLFSDQIECVVLNACYSEVQARAIAQNIPYVIGMSKAIKDKAAIEFAVGFYDGLGAGRSVEFAYELGCNSIEIAGIPEHLTPQLLSKANLNNPFPNQEELNDELRSIVSKQKQINGYKLLHEALQFNSYSLTQIQNEVAFFVMNSAFKRLHSNIIDKWKIYTEDIEGCIRLDFLEDSIKQGDVNEDFKATIEQEHSEYFFKISNALKIIENIMINWNQPKDVEKKINSFTRKMCELQTVISENLTIVDYNLKQAIQEYNSKINRLENR